MERKHTRNETIQALLEKVLSNQEEFSKTLDKSITWISQKRKSDNAAEGTPAKKKMRYTIDFPSPEELNQASQLLEEQDIKDVLEKIPEDVLNDLLSEHEEKNISHSEGALQQELQVDDFNAITSTIASSELNSATQHLSAMTLEAGSYITNLGSSQRQVPMGSLHDAHKEMQMNTAMQVGALAHGNMLPAGSTGNFLESPMETDTDVHTQEFPRPSMQQYYQGPQRNRWPFNHAKSRRHPMVGPSQTGYTRHLDATNIGVSKATMLPNDCAASADGFRNMATMDHGYSSSQAMAQGNTTSTTPQQFHTTNVFIPKSSTTTNAISCLNEICPGLYYQQISRTGPDHSPNFTIAVSVHGVTYFGTGFSKKFAKHAAAEAALKSIVRV